MTMMVDSIPLTQPRCMPHGKGVVKSKRAKMVAFDRQVKVHKIRTWRDMSTYQRAELWLQQADYKAINEDKDAVVNMMKVGQLSHDKHGICIRGLEHHAPKQQEQNQRRQDVRKKSIMAVLSEQTSQRRDNLVDPETLANVYRSSCAGSKCAAHLLGMQDENACQEITNETDQTSRVPCAPILVAPVLDRRTRRARRSSMDVQRQSQKMSTISMTVNSGRPRLNSFV